MRVERVDEIYWPGSDTNLDKTGALLVMVLLQQRRRRCGTAVALNAASWTTDLDQPFVAVPAATEGLNRWGGILGRLKAAGAAGRQTAPMVQAAGRSPIEAGEVAPAARRGLRRRVPGGY